MSYFTIEIILWFALYWIHILVYKVLSRMRQGIAKGERNVPSSIQTINICSFLVLLFLYFLAPQIDIDRRLPIYVFMCINGVAAFYIVKNLDKIK